MCLSLPLKFFSMTDSLSNWISQFDSELWPCCCRKWPNSETASAWKTWRDLIELRECLFLVTDSQLVIVSFTMPTTTLTVLPRPVVYTLRWTFWCFQLSSTGRSSTPSQHSLSRTDIGSFTTVYRAAQIKWHHFTFFACKKMNASTKFYDFWHIWTTW